jgi:hypothetical protein
MIVLDKRAEARIDSNWVNKLIQGLASPSLILKPSLTAFHMTDRKLIFYKVHKHHFLIYFNCSLILLDMADKLSFRRVCRYCLSF